MHQTGDDEADIGVAENIARALQIDVDKLVPDVVPLEHVRVLAQLQGVINFLVDDLLPPSMRQVGGYVSSHAGPSRVMVSHTHTHLCVGCSLLRQYDSELNLAVDTDELALVLSPQTLRGRPSHGTFRIPLSDDGQPDSPTSAQFRPLETAESNLEDVLASGVLQQAVAAARATAKSKQGRSFHRRGRSDGTASTSSDNEIMDDAARALVAKVRWHARPAMRCSARAHWRRGPWCGCVWTVLDCTDHVHLRVWRREWPA